MIGIKDISNYEDYVSLQKEKTEDPERRKKWESALEVNTAKFISTFNLFFMLSLRVISFFLAIITITALHAPRVSRGGHRVTYPLFVLCILKMKINKLRNELNIKI